MDKKEFAIGSLCDNPGRDFWKKKSHMERLAALEQLREIIFGYDPSTARLQRTITITQLKKD